MKVLTAILLANLLVGGPMSVVPLPKLLDRSDLAFVGTTVQQSVSGSTVNATIVIDRIIKGTGREGATIAVVFPSMKETSINTVGLRGLFFTKTRSDGNWDVVSPTNGARTVLDMFYTVPKKTTRPAYSPEDAPADKILRELATALEYREAGPRGAVIDLIGMSRALRSATARAEMARLSQSPRPELRALGLKAAVALGEVWALQRVRNERVILMNQPQFADLMDHIKFYYRNPDPQGIAVLGLLLSEGDMKTQVIAACTLANIHTRETLRYLAPLLDSTDPMLQACGVGGLALFANNVPIGENHPAQGDWPYRTSDTMRHSAMDTQIIAKDQKYVNFWKQWWREHQAQLAP